METEQICDPCVGEEDAVEYKLVAEEVSRAVNRLQTECESHYTDSVSGKKKLPRRVLRHAQQMLGTDVKLQVIREMLQAKLSDHIANADTASCTLEQIFDEVDEGNSGQLDVHCLLDMLAMVGMQVTWAELEQLLFQADSSVDGLVSKQEFISYVQSPDASLSLLNPKQGHRHARGFKLCLPDGVTQSETLLGMLRDMAQHSKRHQLLYSFVSKKCHSETSLTAEELAETLQHNGLPITLEQVKTMCAMHPNFAEKKPSNGCPCKLSMSDFIELINESDHAVDHSSASVQAAHIADTQENLRNATKMHADFAAHDQRACNSHDKLPEDPLAHARDIRRVNALLALSLGEYDPSLGTGTGTVTGHCAFTTLYRKMDTNGDQLLSVSEVYKLITDMGVDVTPSTATRVFARFDKDRSGTIDLNEFLHAVSLDGVFTWENSKSSLSE